MSRSTSGRYGWIVAQLVVVAGLAFLVLTSVSAQAPPKQKDQVPVKQAKKTYRYAPSLALVMVAYEGVLNNDEKANPELVKAMKKSFKENPSARKTIAKIHKAYRALPPAAREAIVGKELAQATGKTRLTKTTLQPIFAKHFKRAPTLLAEKVPALDKAKMAAVKVADKEMELDAKTKIADKALKLRERMIGLEHKEGSSTTYRVDYTGLYCRQEPSDFWFSCEPYVIFTMKQGDSQWTKRKGPYEKCDSGDKFRERMWLRSQTPFNNDLTVVATVFEHDLGDIDEIEDAIHTAVDVAAGVASFWWKVPDWLKDVVSDALTWFADVLGLDDDQIGPPQSIRFTRAYAERHTGHTTWERFEYDTYLRCRGDMRGPRSQRGDFYVFLDVRRYP